MAISLKLDLAALPYRAFVIVEGVNKLEVRAEGQREVVMYVRLPCLSVNDLPFTFKLLAREKKYPRRKICELNQIKKV